MRKLLGGLVLVAGVGGLGWYGSSNNAKTMQAEVTSGAQAATQGTIHAVNTRVSGRDIIVSGIANDKGERDLILSAMNDVNGRRVVRDELRVLDTASPFALNAVKDVEGLSYDGVIPTEVDRAVLASRIGDAAGDLDLMAGVPDGNWTGVVGQGLDGLDVLQDGTLSVSDQTVTLKGIALNPVHEADARAALEELPEGYTADVVITTLDDGTPLRLTMDLDAEGNATASGKIPASLEVAGLADALGGDVDPYVQQSVLVSERPDWPAVSQIGASALGKLKTGQMRMTENTLTVTGTATPEGKAEAEALVASLPDGFEGTSNISLWDDGEPFTLNMTNDGDAMMAKGKFPAGLTASDVVGNVPSDGIRNAYIDDETGGFSTVASNGVAALGQLENGALSVVGTDVTLTGTALTPAEADAAKATLGDLPEGYTANFDIATIDDGTPPNFNVVYSATGGATVDGKLPADTDVEDIAAALGLDGASGSPVQGLIGEGAASTEKLAALSGWLPELDAMTFNSNDDVVSVNAVVAPGVDEDLVQSGLEDALGSGASISLTALSTLPENGAMRMNQATGRNETFTGGYWLPVYDFSSDMANCNAQSAAALEADRVNFVTGSARLDAKSVRAINSVAAILRKCLADTDLNVEIGGHTDSQGGEQLNLELSQARAEAVRSALIARGVSDAETTAKGYGEAEPIADNGTAEGRAANRRTTITWFEPIINTPEVEENAEAETTETESTVGE